MTSAEAGANGSATCPNTARAKLPDLAHDTRCQQSTTAPRGLPDRDQSSVAVLVVGAIPMSSTATQKQLPRYAILHDETMIQRYAQSTRSGVYDLGRAETFWRERQPTFDKRGYILRKRYSPDWKPSWIGTNLNPLFCEDSIALRVGTFSVVTVSMSLTLLLFIEISGY